MNAKYTYIKDCVVLSPNKTACVPEGGSASGEAHPNEIACGPCKG
jgi:hypothetical protein